MGQTDIKQGNAEKHSWQVAALYCFAPLPNYRELRAPLLTLCEENGVIGSLLLAHEGINGTIACESRSGLEKAVAFIIGQKGLEHPELKYSFADERPFHRMKVKLKKEIVTMGVDGVDPLEEVGTYVAPKDWNALIQDKDTILVDTRNDYEYAIGTFEGAIDPDIKSFREFPQWVEEHRKEIEGKKFAMFCTGGIRCEKSTSWAKQAGFDKVYHLKGGILKYLEEIPEEESLWRGQCFVFDERVSLGHGLKEGGLSLCRACRRPLTEEDKKSPLYQEGVSCPACYAETSEGDKRRFAEREKQIALAKRRRARGKMKAKAAQKRADHKHSAHIGG